MMHMRSIGTLLTFMLLFFVGCRPDEEVVPDPPVSPPTTLRVMVVPHWNGTPFNMNDVYVNVNDYRVKVQAIKLYLADVRLVVDGSETVVKDIDFFNLESGTASVEWSVPAGTWTSLRAGLGVPAAMNAADPITYPTNHPLSLSTGTWWSWSAGYRFLQFDGRYDLDGSGTGPVEELFSMHTGMDACYTEFDLDLGGPFTIPAGQTKTLTLRMDVSKFFYSDTDTLDLTTENQTHGENVPLALELTNNAVHSFSAE
jgi:hypothetical protein